MEDFNLRKVRTISLYTILSAAAILIIYQALNNLPEVLERVSLFWAMVMTVLSPIIIGFVIAYLLNPVIVWYETLFVRLAPKFVVKRARGFSVITAIVTVALLITLIASLLVSSVTKQMQVGDLNGIILVITHFIENLNEFYQSVLDKLASMELESPDTQSLVTDLSDKIYGILNTAVADVSNFIANLSGNFTTFLFGLVISIYFMLDGKKITGYINRVSVILFKQSTNERIQDNLKDLHTSFSGYLRGQLSDVLFMMCAISIGLLLAGCKFAIGIGVLAGLANLIPYFGPIVAYALTIIVCVIYGDYSTLLVSVIVLFGIQLIDGNIVGPKLLARSISVHPLLVILFLIAGGAVGGLLGMLLAVPVGGFITIRFTKWLKCREEQA